MNSIPILPQIPTQSQIEPPRFSLGIRPWGFLRSATQLFELNKSRVLVGLPNTTTGEVDIPVPLNLASGAVYLGMFIFNAKPVTVDFVSFGEAEVIVNNEVVKPNVPFRLKNSSKITIGGVPFDFAYDDMLGVVPEVTYPNVPPAKIVLPPLQEDWNDAIKENHLESPDLFSQQSTFSHPLEGTLPKKSSSLSSSPNHSPGHSPIPSPSPSPVQSTTHSTYSPSNNLGDGSKTMIKHLIMDLFQSTNREQIPISEIFDSVGKKIAQDGNLPMVKVQVLIKYALEKDPTFVKVSQTKNVVVWGLNKTLLKLKACLIKNAPPKTSTSPSPTSSSSSNLTPGPSPPSILPFSTSNFIPSLPPNFAIETAPSPPHYSLPSLSQFEDISHLPLSFPPPPPPQLPGLPSFLANPLAELPLKHALNLRHNELDLLKEESRKRRKMSQESYSRFSPPVISFPQPTILPSVRDAFLTAQTDDNLRPLNASFLRCDVTPLM